MAGPESSVARARVELNGVPPTQDRLPRHPRLMLGLSGHCDPGATSTMRIVQPVRRPTHLHTVTDTTDIGPAVNQDDFEAFHRAQWGSMVRLAWLLTGNREDAEDVVHDAFTQLHDRYGDLTAPEVYLRVVVTNVAQAVHRRRAVERRHARAEPESYFDPDIEEIWRQIRALPARQRQVLVLRFYLDMSVEQTAEVLQCPEGTVKSLAHRGLAHLHRRLDP